tara:strand:+ start:1670 stop:1981 length:312 start_codon:yes stop_codon:yes gene_type:complete
MKKKNNKTNTKIKSTLSIEDNEKILDFINNLHEFIRDINETGVDYITYKDVSTLHDKKEDMIKLFNFKMTTCYPKSGNPHADWYTGRVLANDKTAWHSEEDET